MASFSLHLSPLSPKLLQRKPFLAWVLEMKKGTLSIQTRKCFVCASSSPYNLKYLGFWKPKPENPLWFYVLPQHIPLLWQCSLNNFIFPFLESDKLESLAIILVKHLHSSMETRYTTHIIVISVVISIFILMWIFFTAASVSAINSKD